MIKAVVDRVVDGKYAVLLLGEKEVEKILPIHKLPEGTKEGKILRVFLSTEGEITQIEFDDMEEAETRSRIADKMALLKKRSKE